MNNLKKIKYGDLIVVNNSGCSNTAFFVDLHLSRDRNKVIKYKPLDWFYFLNGKLDVESLSAKIYISYRYKPLTGLKRYCVGNNNLEDYVFKITEDNLSEYELELYYELLKYFNVK